MNDYYKGISFEMFTKAGDKACASLVNKAIRKLNGKAKVTQSEIVVLLQKGMNKISLTHREVGDSEPPYHVARLVNKEISKCGYNWEIDCYDIA